MSGTVTTIEQMAERITLQKISADVDTLSSLVASGFSHAEKAFRDLKDRADRMDYGIYQLQKDFLTLDEEIRGIHKVVDNLNIRIVSLENDRGSSPLFSLG
jgi:hypothetical protein